MRPLRWRAPPRQTRPGLMPGLARPCRQLQRRRAPLEIRPPPLRSGRAGGSGRRHQVRLGCRASERLCAALPALTRQRLRRRERVHAPLWMPGAAVTGQAVRAVRSVARALGPAERGVWSVARGVGPAVRAVWPAARVVGPAERAGGSAVRARGLLERAAGRTARVVEPAVRAWGPAVSVSKPAERAVWQDVGRSGRPPKRRPERLWL